MIGQVVSHYKILEKLGEGGMGVVYKAHDTKLDRTVALKFLPPQLSATDRDEVRFTQEARAAASLNHPNICHIYRIDEADAPPGSGRDGEKLTYIEMEYVDGQTLRKRVAGRPLDLDQALAIATQIGEALQEAHAAGIVHRDIKSDNIMVNGRGQVKVMDFGLAKLKGALRLTRSSSTVGTLGYMAPEQIQGVEADARSDVFSFGVVLYEMLSGRMPFQGAHEAAMMYSILNEPPAPLEKFLPGAPPELLHVINRALEKDREDRYQTAHDMVIDLRRLRKDSSKVSRVSIPLSPVPAGNPVHAPATADRTTTVTLKIPTMARSLQWLIPVVLVVAAAIAYLTLFSGGETDAGGRIPVAVADFQNQTKEEELDGLSGMLITSLEQSRRLSVMTRSRMFDVLRQLGKADVPRVDEQLGREICRQANVGALVVASVSKFDQLYIIDMKVLDPVKNEYLLTLKEEGEGKSSIPGMIDRLSEQTRLGLKEASAEVSASSRAVAEMTTPSMEAYQAYFRGEELINRLKFDSAVTEFRRAVAIDSTFAVAHYRLAYALEWNSSPGASEAIRKAMQYVDGVPKREGYLIRGENAMIDNNPDLGLSIYKELLALYPDDKEANYLVGDYSTHRLDYAAAEAALTKVLTIDPAFARAYQHLGWVYMFQKRFRDMREVNERYVRVLPSPISYQYLAESFLQAGMFDSALAVCRRGAQAVGDDGRLRSMEGTILLTQHRFAEAEALYRAMAESGDGAQGTVAYGLAGLVTGAVWSGKYREALRRQDRVIAHETGRKDSTRLALAVAARAHLTMVLGRDAAGAKTWLDRALGLSGHGNTFYHFQLLEYYRATGQFDRAAEIVRAQFLVPQPYEVQITEGLRRQAAGDHASAIRIIREVSASQHEWMLALAKSYDGAGQPDSALAVLSRLRSFYGVIFDFDFLRALTEAKAEHLAGRILERKGDRKGAAERYRAVLAIWKNADSDIPELVDTKERLAALGTQ